MEFIDNINNFFLLKKKDLVFVEYTNFLNKKKKFLKFKLSEKKIFKFIIGYKIKEHSGEYTEIIVKNKKIQLITDSFLSYPIYFYNNKKFLVLSTSIKRLHDTNKLKLKINDKNLIDHYNFGFYFNNDNTIYKDIKIVKKNSKKIFYNSIIKDEILKSSKLFANKDILEKQINIKHKILNIKKSALALTSGIDSNILFDKISDTKFKFDCVTIGSSKSTDVQLAKVYAKSRKKKIIHYSQNYDRKNNFLKLLNEYAMITSGIGISSEIFLMELAKKISKKYNYLFLGGGGELYRNYFLNQKIFFEKYITPKETLKKFLKKSFFKRCIQQQKKIKEKKIDLKNFYFESRYPRNTNRKNNYIKNYLFPINFLADEILYKNFLKRKTNFETFFDIKKKNNHQLIDAFNIDNFFNKIKKILIKNLKKNVLNKIFLDKQKTLKLLNENKITVRDKWFLLRILNLILYMNSKN